MTTASPEPLLAGYSPEREQPLRSYGVLMGVFMTLAGLFATWFRASGRELPDTIAPGDLALITVASSKVSRLISKDRVTSPLRAPFTRYVGDDGPGEVNEKARGRGLRYAVGELLLCPFCLGMWTSAGLTAGLLVAPRATRWLCSVLTAFFGSQLLQVAFKRAEDAL